MQISAALLKRIAKGTPDNANVQSIVIAMNEYGQRFGLDLPHRAAHLIAQEAHESGGFHYDREIVSGAAYEGRKDLGNTQKGDGKRFKGRTGIQITGRANYRKFTAWVRKFIPDGPDFEAKPELVNTDPYEGLVPIWYWDAGNPTGKTLNVYADQNNIEMITRKINGGLNGFDDRLDYYDRTALVMLGYPLGAYKAFQQAAKRKGWYTDAKIDGAPGPKTRAALALALVHMTDPNIQPVTQAAPVVETKKVETKVEVPVETPVPVAVGGETEQKPFWQDPQFQKDAALGGAAPTLTALGGADWKVVAIVAGVLLIGIGAFFLIRRAKQAKVQAQKAEINAQAATIRAGM
ncbi:glycoside hydrolase family 19 protein [Mesorhizobium sp. B2-6-1]|uniref:glycoside hydrolase family 19 protein n=1 Tax=Mesorhizobium sp. B2-6-1 TaxID=2589916 RepID=UPI00112864E1|nr:glycoside hydrolase family 19 protein [Mesorhizobium sp. B2-6-1]TPJ60815.1 glycoside hydrolase family 19 protein [Mesorhizobium sp. B2-6-1]